MDEVGSDGNIKYLRSLYFGHVFCKAFLILLNLYFLIFKLVMYAKENKSNVIEMVRGDRRCQETIEK
jgi:hypothetical protein